MGVDAVHEHRCVVARGIEGRPGPQDRHGAQAVPLLGVPGIVELTQDVGTAMHARQVSGPHEGVERDGRDVHACGIAGGDHSPLGCHNHRQSLIHRTTVPR